MNVLEQIKNLGEMPRADVTDEMSRRVIEDVEMANLFSPVRDDYLTQGALDYMKKRK